MNNFLSKISFRYLFQKGSKKLSSLTILTTLGVGIGTAVLIVVLSIMNGFENELQKRILRPNWFKVFATCLFSFGGYYWGKSYLE